MGDATAKIEDGPWPAFPADLTSIALALATQADGMVMIHEKMFENRLFFVDKLINMGARVILCDPHRAVVAGPRRLHGERMESPDIRAGMALLIAALCAEGTSEIGNIRQIDRGYERIDERLRDLGARIERVDDVPVHGCGRHRDVVEPFRDGATFSGAQHRLCALHDQRRVAGDLGSQVAGGLVQRVSVGQDVVHEADLVGPVGGDVLAGEREFRDMAARLMHRNGVQLELAIAKQFESTGIFEIARRRVTRPFVPARYTQMALF